MKHMLNLLALLSIAFAVQAAPGGPSIAEVEGETGAADVKAGAAVNQASIEQMIKDQVIKPKKKAAMKSIQDYADLGVELATARQKIGSGAHKDFKAISAAEAIAGKMESMEKAEGAPIEIFAAMKAWARKELSPWLVLQEIAKQFSKKLQPPPLPPLPAKRPVTPPAAMPAPAAAHGPVKRPVHVNVKELRELAAITKMIEAVKDAAVLTHVLQFLAASESDLETQVENPNHYNFKAYEIIEKLMKTESAEERAIYDAIIQRLHSFGVGKAAEKLQQIRTIQDITRDASLGLLTKAGK